MDRLKNLDSSLKIKVNKTSITIKDANNKTRGVVRGIETWQSLSVGRRVDLNVKFHKMGINKELSKLDSDKMIFDNNNMYYLVDYKKLKEREEDYKKYKVDWLLDTVKETKNQIEICNKNNIKVLKVAF